MTLRLLIIIVALGFGPSCSQYKGTYREGRFQDVTHSWKYPSLLFPMRITGTRTLIDTVEGTVVKKTRFKWGIGLFGVPLNYERITTYDRAGRKTRIVTVQADKCTTVEYFRK